MARKRSPSQKALVNLADAAGGIVALRGELLARAGYSVELQAEVVKELLDRTRLRAAVGSKVTRLVVADGRGSSHVEEFVDPDLGIQQRADEALADWFGVAPSKSQQQPVAQPVNVNISFVQRTPPAQAPPKVIEAKVIAVSQKPVRP